ncbi:hypothetical protein [Geoalkalibacter halelectricus]|uniref:Uncharacterized protein n=1 Tax=Geoalkalibacter halelectricus TaxID=2847045 RepID=A0ABY5ZRS5_9BACT|nr:hypothetical protein [Geoalkalibacter halelectricus]MDO3377002.1 hypothetical protein [Geoalkalibacter halelectricus]UWZ81224.1 hypothetical protein L9S41_07500 [Geoalkalibacter halelectricus]
MTGKLEQEPEEDLTQYASGLQALRRRRWFLWGLILIYIPMMWLTLELSGSDRVAGMVFVVWILLVAVAVVFAAFAKCPRCENFFHMQGFMPLYLRRCLHCELHVTADKQALREKSKP